MKLIMGLLLLCAIALEAQPSSKDTEDQDTFSAMSVFLDGASDSKPELKAKVVKRAADLQIREDESRTAYVGEINKNGGFYPSVDRVRQMAEAGNAYAQLKLGVAYMIGQDAAFQFQTGEGLNGVPQDIQQSTLWLTQAANNENARAQWMLAMRNAENGGDFGQSVLWFLRLARHANYKAYQSAAAQIKMKQNLSKLDTAQLQTFAEFNKTLTQTEKLAASSLMVLDNLKHGKTYFGNRQLTASEVAIVEKYFNL
jgi:hypothetical protein